MIDKKEHEAWELTINEFLEDLDSLLWAQDTATTFEVQCSAKEDEFKAKLLAMRTAFEQKYSILFNA